MPEAVRPAPEPRKAALDAIIAAAKAAKPADKPCPAWHDVDKDGLYVYDPFVSKRGKVKDRAPREDPKRNDANPQTRLSMYGSTYPESVESDWTQYSGLGWVHKTEGRTFRSEHHKCEVTKVWYRSHDMATAVNEDGQCRIHTGVVSGGGYITCPVSGWWVLPKHCVELRTSDDKKALCSRWYVDHHGGPVTCDFNGHAYVPGSLKVVKGSEKYKLVCHSALKSGAFANCGKCGHWYEKGQVKEYLDIGGAPVCVRCHAQMMRKNVILPHNDTSYPDPIYSPQFRLGHRVGKDGLIYATGKKVPIKAVRLFGCEVETEMSIRGCKADGIDRVGMAISVHETLGKDFVMTKEDGTLNTNGKYSDPSGNGPVYAGFEIVSAAADIAVHRERWVKLLAMPGYKHLRAWDTDTCGFHVHVSRAALTSLQIARMLLFVNCKGNQKFIQKVAGRGSHQFCRYVPKEPGDALRIDQRTDENRRQAINLCNEHTVEFRIFRGTVNPRHIIRNIEFCDAVCDYCYPCTRSIGELSSNAGFIAFVSANRKRWPMLAEWFAFHKYIEIRPAGDKADRARFTLDISKLEEHDMPVSEEKPKAAPRLFGGVERLPEVAVIAGGINVAVAVEDGDDDDGDDV